MILDRHVSHYFECDYGPFLSICDLDPEETLTLIEREKSAETGFNRFSHGQEFFEYRKLADDLLLELYSERFGKRAERRPYYAVLGDSDVVGGLYRDPHKIRIPIEEFADHEVTFMCPDHFHLVGLSRKEVKKHFGFQTPSDYTKEAYPYFGRLLTFDELEAALKELKIDSYLADQKKRNSWYRYVEAQIWADPLELKSRYTNWIEVDPEPYTLRNLTQLQNYKKLRQKKSEEEDKKEEGKKVSNRNV